LLSPQTPPTEGQLSQHQPIQSLFQLREYMYPKFNI